MNILIANKYYHATGGPERYMFSISELLSKNGHKVVPFSIRSSMNVNSAYDHYFIDSPLGDDRTHYDKENTQLTTKVKLTANAIYSLSAKKRAKEIINKEDIDILYTLNICNYLSPSIIDAAKNQGKKVVMRLSDFNFICSSYMFYRDGRPCDDCQRSVINAIKHKCMKDSFSLSIARALTIKTHQWMRIYNKVDAFVAPSQRMKKALMDFGIPEEKVHYVPGFINLENFHPEQNTNGHALYFGRLSPEKGIDVLLDAWVKLADNCPKLLIIGSGEEENKLKGKRDKLGLSNVEFKSFIRDAKELGSIIQKCSFVIIPSLWEDNSPMAAYEAMAYGKPIIASSLGGLRDQVEQRKSGLLVRAGSSEDLAKAIQELCDNPEKIESYGLEGRRRMEKLFSQEKHLSNLETIFAEK
jgi:glycosyltransferase involved in cell wall biosynthesis